MDISFANPAGFWALCGLPAIVAIHFLQRQSRVRTISTLFLLEQLSRQSIRGRKVERIRHSVPLWLQILAVLLLTWILVQPRWIRPESVQRIAVVLDSSASMSVFKNDLLDTLKNELEPLAERVSHTEYLVTESAIGDLTLYNGDNLTEMLATIEQWRPLTGAHDFGESLRIARSLTGGDGLVILATDHRVETLPFNAKLLAVGEPKVNVGFAGVSIVESEDGAPGWRTVVRNYSTGELTRNWFFSTDTRRSPDSTLTLRPGGSHILEGQFPEGETAVTLHLQPDHFPLDDQLPIVLPQPKTLTMALSAPPELRNAVDQIVGSLSGVEARRDAAPGTASGENPADASAADFFLFSYDPLSPTLLNGNALVLLHQIALSKRYFSGAIAAENHPLMNGLNWQGLIARRSPGVPLDENDTPLLWQDDRALIFLRSEAGQRQLFLNFELSTSNASRLPSFIVLLHRFVESLREEKVAAMSANFETGQALELAYDTLTGNGKGGNAKAAPPLRYRFQPLPGSTARAIDEIVPLSQASLLRAPREPGMFTIDQGSQRLLTAAAHFADTREADLSEANSGNGLGDSDAVLVEKHSETDTHWQIWLLVLLAALLVCWYYTERKRPTTSTDELLTPNS